MATYALIGPGNTDTGRRETVASVEQLPGTRSGYSWLETEATSVDNSTPGNAYTVVETTHGVVSGKWRTTTTKRDMTSPESDAAKTLQISGADIVFARTFKVAFEAIFALHNRVRTLEVTAGNPAATGQHTRAQFQTGVDALSAFTQQQVNDWMKAKL